MISLMELKDHCLAGVSSQYVPQVHHIEFRSQGHGVTSWSGQITDFYLDWWVNLMKRVKKIFRSYFKPKYLVRRKWSTFLGLLEFYGFLFHIYGNFPLHFRNTVQCQSQNCLYIHIYRGGARGGLRGLQPRMFSEKPWMFLLPCPVRIIITEFSCALKSRTAVYSCQEPPTEARSSDWHVNWPTIDKK